MTAGGEEHGGGPGGRVEILIERWLAALRWLVLVPVGFLLLAATGAFAYGGAVFVHGVTEVVAHAFPVGSRIGLFLLVVDFFLIGATLVIAALGFFDLFVSPGAADRNARMPQWLRMRDLNDLKARVIAMIVLVVSVSFVQEVVDVASPLRVLELGAAVALVIGALTLFLSFGGHGPGGG